MRYSRIDDQVKLAALSIPDGGRSEHLVCPLCEGGRTHERSFIVSRGAGAIFYRCYRASCGVRGKVGSVHSEAMAKESPAKRAANPYRRATIPLPSDVRDWLCDRFHLLPSAIEQEGWAWNEETQRVIQPIRNMDRVVIGHNARYWKELDTLLLARQSSKSITYWNNGEEPWRHSAPLPRSGSGTVVLVEDIPSAIRLAYSGYDSIALLGVSAVIGDINRYDQGIICLDADATTTAIRLGQSLRDGRVGTRVVPLPCDVKDMSEQQFEELKEALDGGTGSQRRSA